MDYQKRKSWSHQVSATSCAAPEPTHFHASDTICLHHSQVEESEIPRFTLAELKEALRCPKAQPQDVAIQYGTIGEDADDAILEWYLIIHRPHSMRFRRDAVPLSLSFVPLLRLPHTETAVCASRLKLTSQCIALNLIPNALPSLYLMHRTGSHTSEL